MKKKCGRVSCSFTQKSLCFHLWALFSFHDNFTSFLSDHDSSKKNIDKRDRLMDSAASDSAGGDLAFWQRRCSVLLEELQLRTQECTSLRAEAARAQLVPKLQESLQDMTRQRDSVTKERDGLQLKVSQLQKELRDAEHRHQMNSFNQRLAGADSDRPSSSPQLPGTATHSASSCIIQTSAGPQLVLRQSNAVSSLGFSKKQQPCDLASFAQTSSFCPSGGHEEAEVARVMSIARDAAVLDARLGERNDEDDEELEKRYKLLLQRNKK